MGQGPEHSRYGAFLTGRYGSEVDGMPAVQPGAAHAEQTMKQHANKRPRCLLCATLAYLLGRSLLNSCSTTGGCLGCQLLSGGMVRHPALRHRHPQARAAGCRRRWARPAGSRQRGCNRPLGLDGRLHDRWAARHASRGRGLRERLGRDAQTTACRSTNAGFSNREQHETLGCAERRNCSC